MNAGSAKPGLEDLLPLRWPPIAIAFRPSAPSGVRRISGPAVSGCTYWKFAAGGEVFYTEAADHYRCPIGAYTHGIELPEENNKELQENLRMMNDLGYLKMEEVASIPRRKEAFYVAVYSPLAASPCDPDVILVRANAKQLMLLAEACRAAGATGDVTIMGRPTCALLPEVMQSQRSAMSLGCVGNRVYTGLADDEAYCAIPAGKYNYVIQKLATVVEAHHTLENFHRGRQAEHI